MITISAHFEFKWFLPDGFKLPRELIEVTSGELHWGLNFIKNFNKEKDAWVAKVFTDHNDEYDKVWHNKFAFQEIANGDYIAIDMEPDTYGKIVYLSHDYDDSNGYVMANSFTELLNNWIQIGCAGGESWQWLPFCKDPVSGIDPQCTNALLWLQTIELTD